MREIMGNTTTTPNPQPDWNQTDPTKADYIKNKPDIIGGGGSGEATKVTVKGKFVETFNADTKLDKGSFEWSGNSLENSSTEEDDMGDIITYKSSISPKRVSASRTDTFGQDEIAITPEGVEMTSPSGEVTKVKFPNHTSGEQYGTVELARNQLAGQGTTTNAGLVYSPKGNWNGIQLNNGVPTLIPASENQIDGKTNQYYAIVPKNLDYAVKSVVGEDIGDHERRLEDLESVLLTYPEDKTQAYDKVVQNAVSPNAILDSIGGESVASKNLYNPNGGELAVNEDGSMHLTTTVVTDYEGTSEIILSPVALNAGTYYISYDDTLTNGDIYLKGMSDDEEVYVDANKNSKCTITLDKTTTIYLYLELYENTFVTEDVETDIRVMISKENIPYEPYFEGFRHAPVTRVKSQNAQLFHGELLNGYYSNGNILDTGSSVPRSFKVNLKAGTYTISSDTLLNWRGYTIDDITQTNPKGGEWTSSTFTVAKDCVVGISLKRSSNQAWTQEGISPILMLNRGGVAEEYAEYGGIVDDYLIPNGIKSLPHYGEKFTTIDFENKVFTDEGFTYVFTGAEGFSVYKYPNKVGGRYGVYTSGQSICKHWTWSGYAPYVSNQSASMWAGYQSHNLYWLNILSDLEFTDDWVDVENPTQEEKDGAVAKFKEYLATRYAEGNPLMFRQKVSKEEDITRIDISSYLTDYKDFKLYRVQGGGTITFENEHKIAIPSTITYVKAKE